MVNLKNTTAGSVTAFAETGAFPYSCENVFMATVDVDKSFYLFDVMEIYNYSMMMAQLDNFFIELQNHPQVKGYVIMYGDRDDERSLTSGIRSIQHYIAFRKFSPDRLTIVNGGFRDEAGIEMWITFPGDELPVSTPTVSEKFVTRRARPKK